MFDPTKPIRVRRTNRQAQVVFDSAAAGDTEKRLPLLVVYDTGKNYDSTWVDPTETRDFENIPQNSEWWVNLYDDGDTGLASTREEADSMAESEHAQTGATRLACQRIEIEPGRFDKA